MFDNVCHMFRTPNYYNAVLLKWQGTVDDVNIKVKIGKEVVVEECSTSMVARSLSCVKS